MHSDCKEALKIVLPDFLGLVNRNTKCLFCYHVAQLSSVLILVRDAKNAPKFENSKPKKDIEAALTFT